MMKNNILLFLSIVILSNCQNQNNLIIQELKIQNYITENFSVYEDVYLEINNIISNNAESHIKWYVEKLLRKWQVDSLMIFNREKTKFYTTLNTLTNPWEGGSSDLVQSLYGVKIKGKWHVYLGNQNLIAMRDGYKTNKYEPFTWEELSYLAHEQIYVSFIEFNKNGDLVVRPDLVEKLINPKDICGRNYINDQTEEEGFIKCSNDRYSKKVDSIEFQQLLEEINNSELKERDTIKKVSWWDKLWGAEVPIFETKEWKDYIKNKSKN